MNPIRSFTFFGGTALCLLLAAAPGARAEQTNLCVVCAEPEQTYVCSVTTPRAMSSDKALQLYCIVKTAKYGGHSSCRIKRDETASCEGTVVSYTYDGPTLPSVLRTDTPAPGQPAERLATTPEAPPRQPGEPDTLVEMTTRAVEAGKEGAKATGGAIRDVATSPGRTIGKVGKAAGKGVGKTARGAGSAARFAYDCVKSLFRDCKGEETPEAPVQQPAR